MECKVCGRKSKNEEANFCDYCGASFHEVSPEFMKREQVSTSSYRESFTSRDAVTEHDDTTMNEEDIAKAATPPRFSDVIFGGKAPNGKERPMTFGNWLAVLILPFLPYVGLILFLILMITWAFGRRSTATQRNFARAALIFCVFAFIYMVGFMNVLMSTMEDPQAWMDNLMNTFGMSAK